MADAEPRHIARKRAATGLPLPDNVALVLQGGGALGSFQVGVYEALDAARIEVDWVAGISIGAINAAIIAGNPCERRMERLHKFWDRATGLMPSFPLLTGDFGREMLHELSAATVGLFGVPGMFRPRFLSPFLAPSGSIDAMSFYESGPLAETLDELVDWDLLNDGPMRLSVGAVEVESGNFRFFDSKTERIDKRHIMASGALPPGLPPVEIDGKLWWDGGIVSNTPLSWIVDNQDSDLLVFQVDLFSAAHDRPKNIMDVMSRQKEIQFSSRTRQISNMLVRQRREHEMIARLLDKLPPELREDPDAQKLRDLTRESSLSLVQLIYRANAWEGGSRDYEFSARTMNEHIEAGRQAIAETMTRSEVIAQNIYDGTSAAFDLTKR
ncbi:patatin-like phospholipase family protein [Sphingomonas montanisoli]|uniref:Patatin-like phospholipase family protein n=1 Tax=Sphingomonas montanisoli TaxID=2606412 RepID=A0A5D9C3R1_9SPHN|nr:patatin-like phospholipase family protein [Sphingomonas montanisoli]TZG25922.1 patatin-like phospholipase family protein [Sphingomonas montanisoli]